MRIRQSELQQQTPKGYGKTEIGVMPEDWSVCNIGKFSPFVTSGSRGWADFYSPLGDLFVRITNMKRDSIYLDLSNNRYVSIPVNSSEGKRTSLKNGDILISITADIGISSYIDDDIQKPAYINQHIALVRFDDERIDSKFVSYYLASENIQKLFRGNTDQGAKAGINLGAIREIKFALPDKEEQTAIANALSDVDTLITSLEKLIAKKRAIKTAAMQQLLTGKKRLPPFDTLNLKDGKQAYKQTELGEIPEDWDVRPIGAVLSIRHGRDQKQVETQDGAYPILGTGGEMGRSDTYLYDKPSVLIGRKGTINKPAYMDSPFRTVDTLFYSEVDKRYSAKFIYYKFCMIDWLAYNEASGVPSLNASTIEGVLQSFPVNKDEQITIAGVLSDIDKEIDKLEQRLNKTQQLKQGMMQELLTGRTRLV